MLTGVPPSAAYLEAGKGAYLGKVSDDRGRDHHLSPTTPLDLTTEPGVAYAGLRMAAAAPHAPYGLGNLATGRSYSTTSNGSGVGAGMPFLRQATRAQDVMSLLDESW